MDLDAGIHGALADTRVGFTHAFNLPALPSVPPITGAMLTLQLRSDDPQRDFILLDRKVSATSWQGGRAFQ